MKLAKAIIILGTVAGLASTAFGRGSHYVRGYTKKNGTYVAPHYQTNPNHTKNDNWSTKGNINPYTGKEGTKPGDSGNAPIQTPPKSEEANIQPNE